MAALLRWRDAERAEDALRAVEAGHPKDLHDLVRRLERQARDARDPEKVRARDGRGYVTLAEAERAQADPDGPEALGYDPPEVVAAKLAGLGGG